MERKIAGIKWEQKVNNERLREITGSRDLGYAIRKLKMKYVGHMARERGDKVLKWVSREKKEEKDDQVKGGKTKLNGNLGHIGKGWSKTNRNGERMWRRMPKWAKVGGDRSRHTVIINDAKIKIK